MKCAITGEEIKRTFLGKIIGTVVKDSKGKKHYISAEAQKNYRTKEEMLNAISL